MAAGWRRGPWWLRGGPWEVEVGWGPAPTLGGSPTAPRRPTEALARVHTQAVEQRGGRQGRRMVHPPPFLQYNINVDHGQSVDFIDYLFAGEVLGQKSDIADGSLRKDVSVLVQSPSLLLSPGPRPPGPSLPSSICALNPARDASDEQNPPPFREMSFGRSTTWLATTGYHPGSWRPSRFTS